jgi:signal transduction histidine kinase
LRHDRRNELAWAAFCVACAVAMLAVPQWQTVPFHWIWITLTFVYGFRRWSVGRTALVLAAVMAITAVAMLRSAENTAELSEIPLMTCVFLGMAWHVRRRQDAVDEQRRGADRERRFMHDAAHTLRTPLTIAQGHAELMLDDLPPGTPSHDDAVVIVDELRRLTRIADQLLILGTADREDALLLEPVALHGLARMAAGRWTAASGRTVTVEAGAEVVALGDERRLRHALDALVENALNVSGAGDEVTVGAATRDGRAVLTVSDRGPGIAAADLGRIFERFARGPDASARPGTGLGLPIVRAIAQAHRGRIAVAARPGGGTTFTLVLGPPLRENAPADGGPARPPGGPVAAQLA